MTAKNNVLKMVCSLFIWTFIVIGLFSWYGTEIVQNDCATIARNSRLLLQKVLLRYESMWNTSHDSMQSELLVDNRTALDDNKMVHIIETRLPSLPIVYWSRHKNLQLQMNATCAQHPSIYDLEFNNVYWQSMHSSNGIFQLYGAYYDMRKKSILGPAVRILGMIDRVDVKLKTFCQFWFEGHRQPVIVEMFGYRYIWRKEWSNYKQGSYQPYLIICKIPELFHGFVPNSVSLVEKECDTATNNLRVIYNRPSVDKKKSFAVCVRSLNFLYEDISVRLIEWIEMLNILGANKIYFYHLQLHPNVSKVLSHYEQEGKVEVMPLTLPGRQPNAPGLQHLFLNSTLYVKQQNQIIPYNDCFYKNMYLYDYITMMDIDEVIMPKGAASNWTEMTKNVLQEALKGKSEGYHSYCYQNFSELQPNSANQSNALSFHSACFHDTERVFMVDNHFPLGCLDGTCTTYRVNTQIAQLQQFRSDCVWSENNCKDLREDLVEDKTIWNNKDELRIRTKKRLLMLGFLRRLIRNGSNDGISLNTSSGR